MNGRYLKFLAMLIIYEKREQFIGRQFRGIVEIYFKKSPINSKLIPGLHLVRGFHLGTCQCFFNFWDISIVPSH